MSEVWIWGPALPCHDYEDWPEVPLPTLTPLILTNGLKVEDVSSVCECELPTSEQKHSKHSDPGWRLDTWLKETCILEIKPTKALRVRRCLLSLCKSSSTNTGGCSVPKFPSHRKCSNAWLTEGLQQVCQTRSPWAACSPQWTFLWHSQYNSMEKHFNNNIVT